MKKFTQTVDGHKLTFGPLLASTLETHQDAIGRAGRGEMADPIEFTLLVVTLVTLSLQRVDPKVTREQVADMVDVGNAQEFFAAAFGVSIPQAAPGEEVAASP